MILEAGKVNKAKLALRVLLANKVIKITLPPGREGGKFGIVAYWINNDAPTTTTK